MFQFSLTRQEKNVLLAVAFCAIIGIGISFISKASGSYGKIEPALNLKESPKVNLNTAAQEQLVAVKGIGKKTAEKIIEYRQKHGKFYSLEELKKVSGIADKKFKVIEQSLTIE